MPKKRAALDLSRSQLALLALAVAAAGWLALIAFTYALPPSGAMLPAFFAILFVATSASALLLLLWIGARLQKGPAPAMPWQSLRQAIEIGLWATLCVWLQWVRLLNLLTALLFLAILILIEWFIRSRQ